LLHHLYAFFVLFRKYTKGKGISQIIFVFYQKKYRRLSDLPTVSSNGNSSNWMGTLDGVLSVTPVDYRQYSSSCLAKKPDEILID
jgi:hypothetical protein